MTYCLAIALDTGLVFASDSRTHAGVDYISTYRKTHTFVWEDDRVFVLLSAGNLATTQAVVKHLQMDVAESAPRNLRSLNYMHQVAEYIGKLSTDIQNAYRGDGASQQGVSFEATGLASPKPCAATISSLTPCEIRNCMTVSARFCDNSWFEATPRRRSAGPIGALSV